MPHQATRRWTLPLTALLIANMVLVASAFWHVGNSAEQVPSIADASLVVVEPEGELLTEPSPDEPSPIESSNQVNADAGDESPAFAAEISPDPWGDSVTMVLPAVVNDPPAAAVIESPAVSEPNGEVAEMLPVRVARPAPIDRAWLVIVNPPATGGVVHLLIGDEVVSLAPGELVRLPADDAWHVRFHRGDEFGDANEVCPSGVFAFSVGENGWALREVDANAAARLLKVCVPASDVSADDN